MITFYILRHAEKEKGDFYNPYLKHQDEPISQTGQQEAQSLWRFFVDKPITAIYISEYLRTRQTIEHVANRLGLVPITDKRLNEIDNGRFEGMSADELQQMYPEQWKTYRERKQDFRFPEGETGQEASRRIVGFLAEKQKIHDLENIILVSHEGLIRLLMCHITNQPVYKRGNFQIDPCGIMEITYQPEYKTWKLIRFNHTEKPA